MLNGSPALIKSINLYCPGPNTIKFVWYPIGVMKLAEAPKHTAIKKGLGSTINVSLIDIATGVITTPIAVFETPVVLLNRASLYILSGENYEICSAQIGNKYI